MHKCQLEQYSLILSLYRINVMHITYPASHTKQHILTSPFLIINWLPRDNQTRNSDTWGITAGYHCDTTNWHQLCHTLQQQQEGYLCAKSMQIYQMMEVSHSSSADIRPVFTYNEQSANTRLRAKTTCDEISSNFDFRHYTP